jgi:hypothetical protein
LVLLGIYLCGTLLPGLPARTGKGDFRAYWSASHLLANGRNFSSDETLLETQTSLTGWDEDYAMKTWNPPWVLVWLLPYGVLGFEQATMLWMFTNIVLLAASVLVAWRLFPAGAGQQKWLWGALLLAVLFPSSLVAILYGQVNLLVLFGLVMFFYFRQAGRPWAAGIALALTMAKPHIVYLALAIILLQLLRERRWRTLAGFTLPLLLPLLLTWLLRPTFVPEYLQSVDGGQLLQYGTPTLVTYLALQLHWPWLRLLGLLLLPLLLLWWWKLDGRIPLLKAAGAAIFLSLVTAPFGWSYDFVVLLLPLTQLVYWLQQDSVPRREALFIAMGLILIFLIYYLQRAAAPSELYFFWVPVALALLYFGAWWRYRPAPAMVPLRPAA